MGFPLPTVSIKPEGYAKEAMPLEFFRGSSKGKKRPLSPIRFTVTEGKFPAEPYKAKPNTPIKDVKVEKPHKYIPFKRVITTPSDGNLDLLMSQGTFVPAVSGYYVFNFSAKCTSAEGELALDKKSTPCKLSLNRFDTVKRYKNLITLTIDENQQASKEVTVYLYGGMKEVIMLESDSGYPTQLEDVTFSGYQLNDQPIKV